MTYPCFLLGPMTALMILLTFITSPLRAQDASASRREQFLGLLLRGSDPVTERARERSNAQRKTSVDRVRPASTPSSAMIRPSRPATAFAGNPLAASTSNLEQKAARLQKKLAKIQVLEQKLKDAGPIKSASEAAWLSHAAAVIREVKQQTVVTLNTTEKQLASPTTPTSAVDALRLRATPLARHGLYPEAPISPRRTNAERLDRRGR